MWNEFCGVLNEHSALNLQHCQTSVGDDLCIIGVKNKRDSSPTEGTEEPKRTDICELGR